MAKTETYESAFKRLEDITEKLETGSLSIDESISLFEEGTKLAAFCRACLDKAEQKITKLKEKEND